MAEHREIRNPEATGGDGVTAGEGNPPSPSPADIDSMKRRFEARIMELEAETRQLHRQLANPPVINVSVAAPTHPARLKTFTGRAPTGGNELSFSEWEQQTVQLLQDSTATDVVARVRGSLKGLAWEQARKCASAEEILTTIRTTFGPPQSAEDLYQAFQEQKILKKERASEFLLRLWDGLTNLNRVAKFTQSEFRTKLYRTFIRGLGSAQQLISLELRTKFGMAGSSSPDPSDLLRMVKQLEENEQGTAAPEVHSRAQQTTTLNEADLEKIIAGVTQRLQAQAPFQPPSAPVQPPAQNPIHDPLPSPSGHQSRPRGPCYRCGQIGHIARNCQSRPASRGQSVNGPQSRAGSGQ